LTGLVYEEESCDDDDDNDSDNVGLLETQPDSIESEALTCPAEELDLLVWTYELCCIQKKTYKLCKVVYIMSEHSRHSLATFSSKKVAKKECSSSSSQNLFLYPKGLVQCWQGGDGRIQPAAAASGLFGQKGREPITSRGQRWPFLVHPIYSKHYGIRNGCACCGAQGVGGA
jgi:hypothetical protein